MNTPYPDPITPTQTRIGWIGTGVMGAAMASRLLSAGYSLTIYARNPSKTLSLQSQGAHLAPSPADVARVSDVVFTMLGHPSDVRQIVLSDSTSILSSLNPGAVVVDHTSSHPELAKQIFAAAREKKCWAVDAPVSGGDIGAREGKLAILAGGDEGIVKWLSPLFSVMGKPNYVGGPGCGQNCKIANQITVGGNLVGLSEGFVFAKAAGLDLGGWLEAAKGGAAGSMVMELFGERMIRRDFRAGGFAEYMVKDLGMGVDVVEEDGEQVVALPGAALSKQLFSGMVANGDGKLGTQGIISVTERINGKYGSATPLRTIESQINLEIIDLDDKSEPVPEKYKFTRARWTNDEDLALTEAVQTIGQCPMVGNSQKSARYWKRVADYYNEHRPSESILRNIAKLTPRWSTRIAPSVRSFNEIYNRLRNSKHSSWSDDILMKNARAVYHQEKGQHFHFEHVWDVLRTSGSFSPQGVHTNKKFRTSESEGGHSNTSVDVEDVEEIDLRTRSIGQRAAKRIAKAKGKVEKSADVDGLDTRNSHISLTLDKYTEIKKIEAESRKIEAESQKIEAEARRKRDGRKERERLVKDIAFLTKDTSNMSPENLVIYQRGCEVVKAQLRELGYEF